MSVSNYLKRTPTAGQYYLAPDFYVHKEKESVPQSAVKDSSQVTSYQLISSPKAEAFFLSPSYEKFKALSLSERIGVILSFNDFSLEAFLEGCHGEEIYEMQGELETAMEQLHRAVTTGDMDEEELSRTEATMGRFDTALIKLHDSYKRMLGRKEATYDVRNVLKYLVSPRKTITQVLADVEEWKEVGTDTHVPQALMDELYQAVGVDVSIRRLKSAREAMKRFRVDQEGAVAELKTDAQAYLVLNELIKECRDPFDRKRLEALRSTLILVHRFGDEQIADIAEGKRPDGFYAEMARSELGKMLDELGNGVVIAINEVESYRKSGGAVRSIRGFLHDGYDFRRDAVVEKAVKRMLKLDAAGYVMAFQRVYLDGKEDEKVRRFADEAVEGEAKDEFYTDAGFAGAIAVLGTGAAILGTIGAGEVAGEAIPPLVENGLAALMMGKVALDEVILYQSAEEVFNSKRVLDLSRAVVRESEAPTSLFRAKWDFIGAGAQLVAVGGIVTGSDWLMAEGLSRLPAEVSKETGASLEQNRGLALYQEEQLAAEDGWVEVGRTTAEVVENGETRTVPAFVEEEVPVSGPSTGEPIALLGDGNVRVMPALPEGDIVPPSRRLWPSFGPGKLELGDGPFVMSPLEEKYHYRGLYAKWVASGSPTKDYRGLFAKWRSEGYHIYGGTERPIEVPQVQVQTQESIPLRPVAVAEQDATVSDILNPPAYGEMVPYGYSPFDRVQLDLAQKAVAANPLGLEGDDIIPSTASLFGPSNPLSVMPELVAPLTIWQPQRDQVSALPAETSPPAGGGVPVVKKESPPAVFAMSGAAITPELQEKFQAVIGALHGGSWEELNVALSDLDGVVRLAQVGENIAGDLRKQFIADLERRVKESETFYQNTIEEMCRRLRSGEDFSITMNWLKREYQIFLLMFRSLGFLEAMLPLSEDTRAAELSAYSWYHDMGNALEMIGYRLNQYDEGMVNTPADIQEVRDSLLSYSPDSKEARKIAKRVRARLRKVAAENDIQVEITSENLELNLNGQAMRDFERVLENLLKNAIIYALATGKSKTATIIIKRLKDSPYIMIEVYNSGRGIPIGRDRYGTSFERYFPEVAGTGIGAQSVRRILAGPGFEGSRLDVLSSALPEGEPRLFEPGRDTHLAEPGTAIRVFLPTGPVANEGDSVKYPLGELVNPGIYGVAGTSNKAVTLEDTVTQLARDPNSVFSTERKRFLEEMEDIARTNSIIVIITHTDTDGMTASAQLKIYLESKGIEQSDQHILSIDNYQLTDGMYAYLMQLQDASNGRPIHIFIVDSQIPVTDPSLWGQSRDQFPITVIDHHKINRHLDKDEVPSIYSTQRIGLELNASAFTTSAFVSYLIDGPSPSAERFLAGAGIMGDMFADQWPGPTSLWQDHANFIATMNTIGLLRMIGEELGERWNRTRRLVELWTEQGSPSEVVKAWHSEPYADMVQLLDTTQTTVSQHVAKIAEIAASLPYGEPIVYEIDHQTNKSIIIEPVFKAALAKLEEDGTLDGHVLIIHETVGDTTVFSFGRAKSDNSINCSELGQPIPELGIFNIVGGGHPHRGGARTASSNKDVLIAYYTNMLRISH